MHDATDNFERRLLFWRVGAVSWGGFYVALLAGFAERAVALGSGTSPRTGMAIGLSVVALLHVVTIGIWFVHLTQRELKPTMRTAIARTHAVGLVIAGLVLISGVEELRILSVATLLFYPVGVFSAFARPLPEGVTFAHAISQMDPSDHHHTLPISHPTITRADDDPPSG